jgi:hypothetical protein
MQVHSIISNTISEEILSSGHLSIRFMADGFSLLLEDRNYQPVVLIRFTGETAMTRKSHLQACEDWLQRHTLLEGFLGEITLVIDALPSTLVPDEMFSEKDKLLYLEPVTRLHAGDKVECTSIRSRPFHIVYAIPADYLLLVEKLSGHVRIKSSLEVLFSVADQVNAADHQRGFALMEVQEGYMGILMIRNDALVIATNQHLGKPAELVYHTLNTIQQMEFDRASRPLYYAGVAGVKELGMLQKYIRGVHALPYHIDEIDKSAISEHVLLAEATKCA